jgi:hypothetical protein
MKTKYVMIGDVEFDLETARWIEMVGADQADDLEYLRGATRPAVNAFRSQQLQGAEGLAVDCALNYVATLLLQLREEG